MFPIPQIQIHQQYARLEFKANRATLEIEQPRATIEMHTKQAQVHVKQAWGELHVDNSRAFEALGIGGVLAMNKRVAEQMPGIVNEAIAKIVENGHRMAAIQNKHDSVPQLAFDNAFRQLPEIRYLGEPSYLNVSEEYIVHPAEINAELGEVVYQATPNRPIIESQRGAFDAYLAQRNAVEITPPQIDQQV